MKKIYLAVLLGSLFLLACPCLTQSADIMVGYYPFSGNANDESGFENNGTVYGAQLTMDRSGENLKAYNFDGENDYIGLPRRVSLYPYLFTISAWIKIKEYGISPNVGSIIFSNYYAGSDIKGLIFYITDNGRSALRIHNGISNSQTVVGADVISKNEWHQVICSYDGDKLSVYVDGQIKGILETTILFSPFPIGGSPTIGKPSWASCMNEPACFNGIIDDVRLYDYAFLDSDVQKLYNTEKPENNNFSFVHITDVHLGSNDINYTRHAWREEQSYPRFADTLYEISNLQNKPDFVLIGGDNVEYAGGESGLRYLRDFKSMIDSFTANTGIEVYVVPGNHDRYERPVGDIGHMHVAGGDDLLENYHKVMTELPANEILFFNETLNNEISGDGGYNRYNYYFTDKHKGVKFIGMDSGEDNHETMDFLPESEGLSDMHINILENMEYEMPKVVFMHSPVYNDFRMGADLDYWFNGSILHNLPEFLGGFCSVYNTKLILSGHTHQSEIYDLYGNKIEEPAFENTRLATTTRSLFIQTPSVTKDEGDYKHGYRIIDVEDGNNIFPRTPSITDFKPKVIIDLCIDHGGYFVSDPALGTNEYVSYKDFTCDNNISLKFFNPWTLDVQYITPQGENVNFPKNASFFTASSSNRLILYEDDFLERSKIEIYNPFFNERQYNLVARRDNYEIKNLFYDDTVGLRINNTKFGTYPFILASSDENQLMIFKNIAIHPNSGQKLIINWDIFQGDNGTAGFLLSGDMNNNGIIENDEQADSSNAQLLPLKYTVDLGSPGELRVYNEAGEVSGLAEREIKEDIPYSIYIPEDEKVIIFSDDSRNNNYKYEVAGTADDTYDLEIKSEKEGEDAVIFKADAIQTKVGINHRYSVDWEALRNNEDSVIIEIDNDGDGQYEHSANIGAEFFDKIAPVSKIFVNGEAVGGWINVAVEVSFYAGDNDGGIGVEKIEYSLDGGLAWLEYSDPFVIGDEGIHNIVYRAADYFGNQEEIRSADIKIDMTSPEAKIFASINNADLEIKGMDNLTSVATVWENDNICTITDEAGNFIKLDFDKIKEKKKLVQAKIDKIEYGDGTKSFLPKNHLIYTWAMPNNILLNQIIEVKNEFNVSASYDKKLDQTIVKYRDSGNKKIESWFDGLKILELFTAQGKLNYQF